MIKTFAIFLGLLLSSGLSSQAWAAAAYVSNMSGTLSALKPDGKVVLLSQKSEVEQGYLLTTEKDSYALIKFTDGGEITLRPNSTIKIEKYGFNEEKPEQDGFVFSLVKGGLRSITGLIGKRGNRDAYRLNTATATIGIRGTHFGALWSIGRGMPDGLYLDVIDGVINAANEQGNLDYGAGQFGFVGPGMKPVLLPKDPGLPPLDEGDDQMSGAGCTK